MVNMPTEGTDVFDRLQAELKQARRDLSECQAAASRLDAQMHDFVARRGEVLMQLARQFLPEISRPAVERTFEGIRADLLAILARRDAKERSLEHEAARLDDEARRSNEKLNGVTDLLNEKVAQREQLEARVAEILKTNDEFQQRSKIALQAEEQLHRNEQRVAEIETEAREKLPHYESSRLFRYLYERGFGTPSYAATGWTRSIDAWVAKLIGYIIAKNGYDFLKNTPALVAAEVAKRRDQFTQLMQQVEAIQRAEADKIGLTRVLSEGEALGKERDGLVKTVEELKKEAEGCKNGLAALQQTQNQFYSEALERFRKFLSETKVAVLEQRARQTPEPEDDEIVAELTGLDRQIDEVTPRRSELGARRKAADRRQEGLDLVATRYRHSNFDSQRSYFEDGFDFLRALDQYDKGSLDSEGLWQSIRSAQRFRPHRIESAGAAGAQVIFSPTGRVLMDAILNAANQAMTESAYRGAHRRGDVFFPTRVPQVPVSFPSPPSMPRLPEGGFSSGEGF
jgi:hypothetical protein